MNYHEDNSARLYDDYTTILQGEINSIPQLATYTALQKFIKFCAYILLYTI